MLNRFVVLMMSAMFLAGCGVKGSPLPPLNPAPLGRGEPTYSEATKKEAPKKRLHKEQNPDEASTGGSGL